jgi:hypothetical protein
VGYEDLASFNLSSNAAERHMGPGCCYLKANKGKTPEIVADSD